MMKAYPLGASSYMQEAPPFDLVAKKAEGLIFSNYAGPTVYRDTTPMTGGFIMTRPTCVEEVNGH